ncbi:DedA family protein [Saxibacter everestensis]|uniref:DedA family protein n=1 Tax=Saxibacter everestensis TaxID=2909229 RepID=A0ABY8QVC9_9MICO|nr:DedA family protein [Brevibacteriaceae bacterium ZFBP1038]
MLAQLDGLPFSLVYLALFAIVFARAQLTYWLGRLAGVGARRIGWGRRLLDRPQVQLAEQRLNRYGAPAISLSFLTVGLQTAINALAGAARMPFLKYLLAMLVGCAAWALVYSTIGIAALWAWVAIAAESPFGAAVIATLIVAAVVSLVVWRRRRAGREAPEAIDADEQVVRGRAQV